MSEISQKHIMLVEDDASLAEWISDYLNDNGYLVTLANRGDEAVRLIEADNPDLLILDVNLPIKDGFDICKDVRPFYSNPILFLTACDDESDEVLGLSLGADDYLNKPVKPRILIARIKALLRRKEDILQANTLSFGNLNINTTTKTVSLNEERLKLSSNEFDLLNLFASNANKILSRQTLVHELRGIDYDVSDRSIDILISRLRKKLNDNAEQAEKIKTIWGKGYLFASDAWLD